MIELLQFGLDFILHLDRHLVELLALYGPWIYAILFIIVFSETGLVVTPWLPGDSLLFAVGALCAIDTSGTLEMAIVGPLLIVAAILGTLLGVALVAVTFNTIRLQVLTRREEIEVIKLIGATDAFIQRPFLYFGALQGLAGGAVAWGIVSAGAYLANRSLGELSHVYAALLQLNNLTPGDSLVLLLTATALGWLGAWISVSRHLALIEPYIHKSL